MIKTYADECIERCQKGYSVYIDPAEDVYELARRLKKAIKYLRNIERKGFGPEPGFTDELEKPLEKK